MWRHKYSTTSSPWKRTDNTAKRPTPFRVEKAKFEKKKTKIQRTIARIGKTGRSDETRIAKYGVIFIPKTSP